MNLDGLAGRSPEDDRRKLFEAELAVERDKYAAELIVASLNANKTAFEALMSGLEFVKQFDATEPLNARLIAAFQEGMMRMSVALANGERSAAAISGPFSEGLNGSSTSISPPDPSVSPARSNQSERQSLPNHEQPRKAGRPPGAKNKQKTASEPNAKPRPEHDFNNGRF